MNKRYHHFDNRPGGYHPARLYLALFLLITSVAFARAQKSTILPGPMTSCPAHFEDQHTSHAVPKRTAAFQKSLRENATAEFDVTFGPGAQADPDVQAAFQFALDIWASEIVSSVPIRIFADFADLGPGVLASAGPTYVINNFDGAPVPDVYYNAALANTLAGEVLDPTQEFDLRVNIGNGINWYFGTDGQPGPGEFDFVTVALHEAGHGLGFISLDEYFDDGTGTFEGFGLDFTGIYNTFIINGDGTKLTEFPSPSIDLGDQLISDNLFIDGPNTLESFDDETPQIFAPRPYRGGSSISHWNEGSFPAGDPNSLMTPQVGSQESNFDIGDITRGLFRDLGWVFSVDDTGPLRVSPGVITEVIGVDTSITREIELDNVSEEAITVLAQASPGGSFISFPSGDEATIASLASETLVVEINTTDLPRGIYEESIDLIVVDGEDTVTVGVVIQVLDGTEAPSIEVDPTIFVDTVIQFSVATEDLTILNTGDADLTFSVDVLPANPTSTFASRVEQTQQSISQNGFTRESVAATGSGNPLATALSSSDDGIQKVAANLYAADFEDFDIGDLNGQMGWFSRDLGNYVITDENPTSGSLHLRSRSDGLGGSALALSPVTETGTEPLMIASADISISGSGVTWEFIPQSIAVGTVITRVRFNPDQTIDVLELGASDFVRIEQTTPDGYFNLQVVVDQDESTFDLVFDGEVVFSGIAFATRIDQIALLSPMEVTGSTLDIDNLEIIDGDPDAFFLTVTPTEGTVAPDEAATLEVRYDGRILIPGTYFATINVNSNDLDNSTVAIPVTLVVTTPPTIVVAPDSLSAAVDTRTDGPAVATRSFTVSNEGQNDLTFTTAFGATSFDDGVSTPGVSVASLDLRDYGLGNTRLAEYVSVEAVPTLPSSALTREVPTSFNVAFTDSLFYDSGSNEPTNFIGVNDPSIPISSAIRFDPVEEFTLTAVRNYYSTSDVTDPAVILEVYLGGETPATGRLLTSQVVGAESEIGDFQLEILNEALTFQAGESFWVVHKYPAGIDNPQAVDEGGLVRPGANLFSIDAGETWDNPDDEFIILARALSDGSAPYIVLEPSSDTLAPGESVTVTASFRGRDLANGVYETDILVNSNDPVDPVVEVATRFEVSGQAAGADLSDEFILFDNVFIGAEKEETIFVINDGLAVLNVNSITSDVAEFTVEPESGLIAAGDSLPVTVTFAPTAVDNYNGIITVATDAPGDETLEVVVNGLGVEPPIAVFDPLQVSETITAGETKDVVVTLSNEGSSPLIYSFPRFAAEAALAQPDVVLNNTEFIAFAEPATAVTEETFVDARRGHPVQNSVGTDLDYGYTWIDNDEEGGPVYNYTDISTTGTDVSDDVGFSGATITALPFPFFFYGDIYTELFIYADGFLAFQEAAGAVFLNGQIPEQDDVNNIIAGFWTNFNPQQGGTIHYEAFEDRFVVQYTDMEESFFGSSEETATFQIVLYPDGTIDVFYEDVETFSERSFATVGIENSDATDGAQVAFNTDYIKDSLAVRFLLPQRPITSFISGVSRVSGVVPAGGSRDIEVTLDATDLIDGVFQDDLVLSSNSPDKSRSTVEFDLTVLGTPELTVLPESLTFPRTFIGDTNEGSFFIENTGTKELEVNSITSSEDVFVVDLEVPFTLGPGISVEAPVLFTPTEAFDDATVITVTSSTAGVEDADITIFGSSVAPPVVAVFPASLSAEVLRGRTVTETLFICNDGGSTLFYTVLPSPAVRDSIAPGDCGEVEIAIDTDTFPVGVSQTEILVVSNDPANPEVIVPLEITVKDGPEITEFLLIDPDTDEILGTLEDADTVNLNDFASGGFNVVAVLGDSAAGSVIFDLNGVTGFRTENKAPFAIGGDNGPNDYRSLVFPTGSNTITATAFSGSRGTGNEGNGLTVTFNVIDFKPIGEVIDFLLIDPDTDESLGSLENGDTVNISQFPSGGFNIVAVGNGDEIGSVVFDLNGQVGFRTENKLPYAIGGDNGPSDYRSLAFPLGANTVTATSYELSGGGGFATFPLNVNFVVVSDSVDLQRAIAKDRPRQDAVGVVANPTDFTVYPNPVIGTANFRVGANFLGSAEISLMNLTGQVIYRPTAIDIGANGTGSVDMSALSPGMYLLVLTDGKGNIAARRKLFKQ